MYYPQIDRSSKHINQIVQIALQFFLHALEDFTKWSEILLQIQLIFNNTSSSITSKIPNEVAYNFTSCPFLDLLGTFLLSHLLVVRAKAFNTIYFAIFNQKASYNQNY